MADGIRIRLTADAQRRAGLTQLSDFGRTGLLWMVRDITRPLAPFECGYCTRRARAVDGYKAQPVTHDAKTYHLELDADLSVIVSTGVWDRLQRLVDNGGFELANTVRKPPTQGIQLPTVSVTLTPAQF